MSFTTTIKQEITKIESTESEMIAELSGFIRNNSDIHNGSLETTSEKLNVLERFQYFIKELYQIDSEIIVIDNVNFSKNKLYQLKVEKDVNKIIRNIGYYDDNNHYLETAPTYIVGANEEIRAYLRGVFLCSGSINDPKTSRYHLELLIPTPEEAVFVQQLLNIFDLNAKIINREKGYMIYVKEAEKISDFLKIIKANNAVLYFEDVRIYRDQKNKTNRLNNCEQANMDKVIQTAGEQIKQIKIIEETNSIDLLDERTQVALKYRKKYPEASLKELAEIMSIETGKTLSKSGLNHRLRKIKELAERLEKNKNS